MNEQTGNKILVVVGMHRSGTSLTANWLADSGLFVGDVLIEGNFSNPHGHYEDKELSMFQRQILRDNGWDTHLVTGTQPIITTEEHERAARAFIKKRNHLPLWGWKDPRTALILDFWKQLLPDMKILVVYRHYTEVVESLLRRDWGSARPGRTGNRVQRKIAYELGKIRYSARNVPRVLHYLNVWQRYNQDILAYVNQYPNDALMLNVRTLVDEANTVYEYMNLHWKLNLHSVAIETVFEADFLRETHQPLIRHIAHWLNRDCDRLYQDLEMWQKNTLQRLHPSIDHI